MPHWNIVRSGPMSFCQELLLFGELFEGCAPTISRLVRITGPLDVTAFNVAALSTLAEHEPLRSTWAWEDDEPISQVVDLQGLDSPVILATPGLLGDAQATLAFVSGVLGSFSSVNPPQMRHGLIPLGEQDHLWVFGVHHMAADAMSLKYYAETFSAAYVAAPGRTQPTGSIDYARVQRRWLASAEAQAQYDWWLRTLEDIDAQALAVRPAVTPSPHTMERQELRLSEGVRREIVQCARRHRVPFAAVPLAAFARTIRSRLPASGVSVFTNVPGRSLPGASTATGAFYNSVPLRLEAHEGQAERAVAAAAEALFQALDHQEVPVSLLSLGAARRGAMPLADRLPVSFNVVDHPLSAFSLPGCYLHEVDTPTLDAPQLGYSAPAPIQYAASPARALMNWLVCLLSVAVVISVEYSPNHSDPADVKAILGEFEAELVALVEAQTVASTTKFGDQALVADWSGPA